MTPMTMKMMNSLNHAQSVSDSKKLEDSELDGDRKKIAQLSEDFEAIFLQLMLKSMRDTVPEGSLVDGGNGEEVFRGMLDSEYAKSMATQRFSGIADAIERSLLENIGQSVAKPAPAQPATKGLEHYKSGSIVTNKGG